MQATRLLTGRATVPVALLALLFGGLSIALETVFHIPLKLPGHRALPAAMALLLFAEAFAPLLLLALAAALPLTLTLLGTSTPWSIAAWLVPAVLLVVLGPRRTRYPLVICVALGLVFGLLRYLTLPHGLHHTPEDVRLVGHLCFGGVGGLLAFPLVRRSKGDGQ